MIIKLSGISTDDSHMSLWHNNKLLMYNGSVPKTRMNDPNTKKIDDVLEYTL